jgi:hypothetical protein
VISYRISLLGSARSQRYPGQRQGMLDKTGVSTHDELQRNLGEVVTMLLEDGEPDLESEFVGVQTIRVE